MVTRAQLMQKVEKQFSKTLSILINVEETKKDFLACQNSSS